MEQEEKNAALFYSYKNGDQDARDKLIMNNLPLVRHLSLRYTGDITDTDDIFQEGCIGLIKALEKYDPDKGVKFSTYAVSYILGEIRAYLRRSGHILKVSRSYHEHRRQLLDKIDELEQKLGRHPRIEELVNALELPKEEIVWLLELKQPLISVDNPDTDVEATETKDFATDTYLRWLMLIEKVKNLPQRDRQIIVLRYFMEKTQEETASLLGITQKHVSRLERKILQQIKEEPAEG